MYRYCFIEQYRLQNTESASAPFDCGVRRDLHVVFVPRDELCGRIAVGIAGERQGVAFGALCRLAHCVHSGRTCQNQRVVTADYRRNCQIYS